MVVERGQSSLVDSCGIECRCVLFRLAIWIFGRLRMSILRVDNGET